MTEKELAQALERALDYIDGMLMGLAMAQGKTGTIDPKPLRLPCVEELHDILNDYKESNPW